MARTGHLAHPAEPVHDGEQAGRRPVETRPLHHLVELLQDQVRRQVVTGEQPQQRAVVAHRHGRLHPVAHHVAHGLEVAAVPERYDVEPVAAHQDAPLGRQVPGGDLHVRVGAAGLGEQGALELQGDAVLAVVAAGVVEVDGGPPGEFPGDHHVLVGEGGRALGPDQAERADLAAPGGERDDERLAQAEGLGGDDPLRGEGGAAALVVLPVVEDRLVLGQAAGDGGVRREVDVLPRVSEPLHLLVQRPLAPQRGRRSRRTPGSARRTGWPTSGGKTSTAATSAKAGTTNSASSRQVVSMSSVVPIRTAAVESSATWPRASSSSARCRAMSLISTTITISPQTDPPVSSRW